MNTHDGQTTCTCGFTTTVRAIARMEGKQGNVGLGVTAELIAKNEEYTVEHYRTKLENVKPHRTHLPDSIS